MVEADAAFTEGVAIGNNGSVHENNYKKNIILLMEVYHAKRR